MPIIDFKNEPRKELIQGFVAQMVHTDQITVAHFNVYAGSILPEHHHIHEQISNVISGSFEMTIDGQKTILTPGMVAVIPSNTPHSGIAITDCTIIDVFCPTREDYRF